MGGSSSKENTGRPPSSPWDERYSYPPPPIVPAYGPPPQHNRPTVPAYAPPPPHFSRPTVPAYAPHYTHPPSHDYGDQSHVPQKKLDRRYSQIADGYKSLDEVTEALANAGLESSNLIIGIDFTKSNEWTGKKSFNNRSLHHIGNAPNPYEQAILIIGKTLAAFDEDNLIPCYGFGDATTHDQEVFSFYPENRACNGFEEALSRYREIIPDVKLAGPTSFAPVIEMAMTTVEQSGGQYHVLVIIADGQVTRSVDTGHGQLSPQEKRTVDAIVEASKFPLSIILVGVGDGPWDTMKEFDDNIPARDFDNFQFVNFTEIMSKQVSQTRKETEFALSALMEIPDQYKATMVLGLLGGHKGRSSGSVPLPPPVYRVGPINHSKPYYDTKPIFEKNSTSSTSFEPTPSAPSTYENEYQLCPICLSSPKDMAFGCGHQTCCECGKELEQCPICRSPIQTRIKLY